MCKGCVDVTADSDVGQDNAPGDDENDKLARHDPHAASAGPGMCLQPVRAEDKLERHLQVNTEHSQNVRTGPDVFVQRSQHH